MKEGLYEIVAMRRSEHGKWVFTARPAIREISFECESDAMEEELYNHARETLWLYIKDKLDCPVLDYFETVEERRESK